MGDFREFVSSINGEKYKDSIYNEKDEQEITDNLKSLSQKLSQSIYLSENIIKALASYYLNIKENDDNYDDNEYEFECNLDKTLYMKMDDSGYLEIGSTLIDEMAKAKEKSNNIDSIITLVSQYNKGEINKNELDALMSDYIK